MQADSIPARWQVRVLWNWVVWAGWGGFMGFCIALFVNTVLFGRLPLSAVLGWSKSATLTILLVMVMVVGWWVTYGVFLRRRGNHLRFRFAFIPAIPLLLGTTLPLVLIYASDLINHYFYYGMVHINEAKTFALLLLLIVMALLLQLLHLELAAGRSLRTASENVLALAREPLIFTLLGMLGCLQVFAYLDGFYADFIDRYWPVADALITRVPYPVTVVAGMWPAYFTEGGLSAYLVDLPVYPVTLAMSFLAFGHNVVAAYMPTVLANIALPMAFYLLSRELFQTRGVALSMVGAVMLFPPLRLYALNWTGPDPVFYLMFVISCWLYVKVAKGDDRKTTWGLLGLSAAAMALTRPEGIAYGLIYVFAALTAHVHHSRKIAVGSLFLAPVGAFSLFMMITFQMPWPRNWTGSLDVKNIVDNWVHLSRGPIDLAAQAMRLSPEELLALTTLLLLVALTGTLCPLRKQRRIAILFVPAWINLLTVFIIDPRVSGALLWYDFFRHVSYPLPLLALAAGVTGEAVVRAMPRRYLRFAAMAALNLLLFWIVMWNIHLLSKPAFSYGADAGNMLGTEARLNFVDLVTHHPFELPILQFGETDGHWATTSWGGAFWIYPNYLREFFDGFDAVGHATGVAYETGSLFIYLGLLALALAPGTDIARQLGQAGVERQ
jgi:hypothetical protein